MAGTNASLAESIERFFAQSDLARIETNGIFGGDALNVLSQAKFAGFGAGTGDIGSRFVRLTRSIADHCRTSSGRLSGETIADVEKIGGELCDVLQKAQAALDPYHRGKDYVPDAIAIAFNQGMLASGMLGVIRQIYVYEYSNANRATRAPPIVAFRSRHHAFENMCDDHPEDAARLRAYSRHLDRLREEDFPDLAAVTGAAGPDISLPDVARGSTVLPKTKIVTENREMFIVAPRYGTPIRGHEWAANALDRLQREISDVRKTVPHLLAAFEADGGELVVTQGKSTLYEEAMFGMEFPEKAAVETGRSQCAMIKGAHSEGSIVASIFSEKPYAAAFPVWKMANSRYGAEINIAAHEMAHQGDRQNRPAALAEIGVKTIDVGYHSYSNIFKICAMLDEVFEPFGATRSVAVTLGGIKEYGRNREVLLQELLPRAVENYASNPASHGQSPIIRAYIENIFLPDMELKAHGATAQRALLKEGMETGLRPIFGVHAHVFEKYAAAWNEMENSKIARGDWSEDYMRSRDRYAAAKTDLLRNQTPLQDALMSAMHRIGGQALLPQPVAAAGVAPNGRSLSQG